MKTILFFVLTQVIFCTFSAAQTREENRAKLDVIKAETSAKQQSGDYGDALKSAQTALRLTLDIYGGEHAEAARAYSDIGELYRLQRKYGASAENFEKAYMIYLRDPGNNALSISGMLQTLGVVLTLAGKREQAEQFFIQQVTNAETAFGKETKATLPALKSLANFYIYTKQHDKADEVFLKQYLIASIYRRKDDSKGLGEISDERYCYMSQHFVGDERTSRDKAFFEKVKAQDEARFGVEKTANPQDKVGGVVNGTALSLPRPSYPSLAKSLRVGGVVSVKVFIDEEGNVISAKAFCGDPIFYPDTEAAAMTAKFSRTLLSGAPVKVSGIINYNFVPPR